MFVCTGAKENLMNKRKNEFYDNYIVSLIDEAKRLGISIEDVVDMIRGK